MMKLVMLGCLFAVALTDKRGNDPFQYPYVIFRQESYINPDGSYRYLYETSNGISADEAGYQKPVGPNDFATSAQGSFQFVSSDGNVVRIQYVADENGFQPSGDVLPTPPPTPAAILRALRYNEEQEKLRSLGK